MRYARVLIQRRTQKIQNHDKYPFIAFVSPLGPKMFTGLLLSTIYLALAVSANPIVVVRDSPVTLSLSRRVNLDNIQNLYQHDLNRAQALKDRSQNSGVTKRSPPKNTPATNQAVSYVASVGVGSHPTQCRCLPNTSCPFNVDLDVF